MTGQIRPRSAAALLALAAFFIWSTVVFAEDQDVWRTEFALQFQQKGPVLVHRDGVLLTGENFAGFLKTIPIEHRWGFLQSEQRIRATLESLLLQQDLLSQALDSGFLEDEELQAALFHVVSAEIGRRYIMHLAETEKLQSYEQQARELFLADPEAFRGTPTWTFRHILLVVPSPDAEVETVDRLMALRERLESGEESFEELALTYSDDETVADNNGLLESVHLSQLDPQFAAALQSLPVGQLSAPVRSQFGWHLIELVSENEGVIPEFDEIKLELEFEARERHRDRIVERLSRDLVGRGGYVHQEALNAFLEEYLEQL